MLICIYTISAIFAVATILVLLNNRLPTKSHLQYNIAHLHYTGYLSFSLEEPSQRQISHMDHRVVWKVATSALNLFFGWIVDKLTSILYLGQSCKVVWSDTVFCAELHNIWSQMSSPCQRSQTDNNGKGRKHISKTILNFLFHRLWIKKRSS